MINRDKHCPLKTSSRNFSMFCVWQWYSPLLLDWWSVVRSLSMFCTCIGNGTKAPLNTVTIRDRWSRILFKTIQSDPLNSDTGCRHPDTGTDDDGCDGMMVPLISILLSIILVNFRMLLQYWQMEQ